MNPKPEAYTQTILQVDDRSEAEAMAQSIGIVLAKHELEDDYKVSVYGNQKPFDIDAERVDGERLDGAEAGLLAALAESLHDTDRLFNACAFPKS